MKVADLLKNRIGYLKKPTLNFSKFWTMLALQQGEKLTLSLNFPSHQADPSSQPEEKICDLLFFLGLNANH